MRETSLPYCIATDAIEMRLPMSSMTSVACLLVPRTSCLNGYRYEDEGGGKIFEFAALLAAEPAWAEVESVKVACSLLLSLVVNLTRSFVEGTWAFMIALQMMPLTCNCRMWQMLSITHRRCWAAATGQTMTPFDVCLFAAWTSVGFTGLKRTATSIMSPLSRRPTAVTDLISGDWSQSPVWGDEATSRRALSICVVELASLLHQACLWSCESGSVDAADGASIQALLIPPRCAQQCLWCQCWEVQWNLIIELDQTVWSDGGGGLSLQSEVYNVYRSLDIETQLHSTTRA